MTTKLTCTAQHPETGVLTFVYECGGRIINFTCTAEELEVWTKSASNVTEMCDAPFKTGPGIFDHPIMSFALYSLYMQIGGNEELVGAELNITAPMKVQP